MAAQLDVVLEGMIQGAPPTSAWAASASNKKRTSSTYCEEEVQLMMGRPLHHSADVCRPSTTSWTSPYHASLPVFENAACSTTLDLIGFTSCGPTPTQPLASDNSSSCCFDLDADGPLPPGWEKCLDLQTGSIYYLNRISGVSTSSDPRKATVSAVNWPTSPSSSSDLTFESNVSMAPASKPMTSGSHHESTHLDLTLSLKPSSPSFRANAHSLNLSFNHDLKADLNPKSKSLITSQGPLSMQSFSSCANPSPFNSSRSCFSLPTYTSSTTTPASGSSFPLGSLSPSISAKASMARSVMQSLNGISGHVSNNASMSVSEQPFHSSSSMIRSFSASSKAEHLFGDTRMDSTSTSPLMTVGCANCLMFVMLPKSCSPKCPRCGVAIDSDLPQPPSVKKPKLGLSFMN